jgi:hypothetical protein
MPGTMLIIHPDATAPIQEVTCSAAPSGEALQKHVDGHIELVPYFTTITHAGRRHACAAFCSENGKLHGRPHNERANDLWDKALAHRGIGRSGDYLVGTIVVVYGDSGFMRKL